MTWVIRGVVQLAMEEQIKAKGKSSKGRLCRKFWILSWICSGNPVANQKNVHDQRQ
jgi:hypothetical protein